MTIGHTYRVRTQGTMLNQKMEFGVHIRHKGPSGSLSDLAASWTATVLPLVKAATSASVNWDKVTLSDVSSTGDESVDFAFTQPAPGAIAGDALPPQNAMLVSLRTGTKGRRRHGRFYLPGISEGNQTNGVLSGSQLTALQALAVGLTNAYGPGGTESNYELVVYSPEALTPPPPKEFKPRAGTLITAVTLADPDDVIRTQRHRAFGVGR